MSADKTIPVKVALRIRPLVQREKADACTECLRAVNGEPQVILGKDKAFTYDYVFTQYTPQVEVYETSVQPLIDALFNGYNTTVLAYGQTGSGKTYTMGTSYSSLCTATQTINDKLLINDADDVGVIPRVLNDLFTKIEEEQRNDSNSKFTIRVSFVEIYNEEIKDLFCMKSDRLLAEPLNIREENNTIRVVNLSEITVTNAITTIQLLERGSSMRVVGGTAMNDQSSRSHAIFTITLEQTRGVENDLIKSKFHLVDLAGSERQSKTKAEGIRLKEGININLGLLALGNVISVLGEDNPSNRVKHVPYRESKLTRLLQDSLGGNSHTVMIACVSPADSNMEETLNTLRYADRARKIKNKPIVNIDPQAAELANLRQQVIELKAHIFQLNGGTAYVPSGFTAGEQSSSTAEMNKLKEENSRLKSENLKLINELQRLININRITYERMINIENEKEEQKKKFDEIKETFDKMSKEYEESTKMIDNEASNGGSQPGSMNKSLINELQSKLGEFEQLKEKEQSNEMQQEENADFGQSNEQEDKDFALRQAKMQIQLTEYDSELMKKQMLFKKMMDNNLSSIKDYKFDSSMDELKSKIELLEKEKEELHDMIRNADVSARKLTEQKRDRLKQLEGEVMDLKKKELELKKMIKLKEENDKHCEKLRQEIQHIKQERVKLLKQMKSDSDAFRKYKQEKEKEVNHLKALERKRMVEITKLQEGNNRQEAVLRRKNEEISRIQKQLRETTEKQKQVAEKRQQAFDRKDTSTLGEKLRSWVTQEIELSVNLAEARINLNKLIEERKESAAELARLEEKLNELHDENGPSRKRKFFKNNEFDVTYKQGDNADDDEMSRATLESRIERIKEDIECKTVQINEIQQTVIEGDQDDRSKHIFNNIHGLLEAKVMLKHLYNTSVQYLLDLKLRQINYETTTNGITFELNELKKKNEVIEEELNKIKKTHGNEISELHQYYEQRILYILKSTCNNPECTNDDRFNTIYEQIQMMEKRLDKESNEVPKIKLQRHLTELTNQQGDNFNDELKPARRSSKAKRDHRRTRVIRTIPDLDSASNSNNNSYEPLFESPGPTNNAYDFATPDDKEKDPDWEKTPLRVKRTSKVSIPAKLGLRKSKSSRSKINSLTDLETVNENVNPTGNEQIQIDQY